MKNSGTISICRMLPLEAGKCKLLRVEMTTMETRVHFCPYFKKIAITKTSDFYYMYYTLLVNFTLNYYICKVNPCIGRKCQIAGKNKFKHCTTTRTTIFGGFPFWLANSMFLFIWLWRCLILKLNWRSKQQLVTAFWPVLNEPRETKWSKQLEDL